MRGITGTSMLSEQESLDHRLYHMEIESKSASRSTTKPGHIDSQQVIVGYRLNNQPIFRELTFYQGEFQYSFDF